MSNSKRLHAPKEEKRARDSAVALGQSFQLPDRRNGYPEREGLFVGSVQQWKSIVKLDHRDQCGSCVNHDTSADATALVIHE